MAKLISKVYGDALFDLSDEKGCLDEMERDVCHVRETFAQNPELSTLLANPDIGKEEKLRLVERIFSGNVSQDMVGFLRILVEKQRDAHMEAIWAYVLSRVKEKKKIGVAEVVSACDISEEWKERIARALLESTGYRQMEMTYRTDPALIGGLRIRIGDTVLDSSIQSKLADMGRKLAKVSLEQKERIRTA